MAKTRRFRRMRRAVTLIEVILAIFVMSMGVLIFGACYPTSSKAAHMSGDYAQAIGVVQHKVDELRSVGYGRLTYSQLKSAGIIDTSPTTSPFHFETTDSLSSILPSPTGTITLTSAGTDLMQVTVQVTWNGAPDPAMAGDYAATILIANQ